MCNKYDRHLWSLGHRMMYLKMNNSTIYGMKVFRSDQFPLDEAVSWMKHFVIPNINIKWESYEMIWYNVCHMCDMNGLECVHYDGGM